MFKDVSGMEVEVVLMFRLGSVVGKGSSFFWRRLRSKNSLVNLFGLVSLYGGKGGSGGGGGGVNVFIVSYELMVKDVLLVSLFMMSYFMSRLVKRDVGNVLFMGLNVGYMSLLVRLFDVV